MGVLLLFLVGAALVLGGASAPSSLGGFALQIISLVLLVVGAFIARRGATDMPAAVGLLAIAVLAALAIQFLPVPAAIWDTLPGRALARETLDVAGLTPGSMPLSLDPAASLRAMLAAVPLAALLTLMAGQRALAPERVAAVVVAIAILSWCLGVMQALGGNDSWLFFHARTNWGSAVGFFANANHFASLLVVCVPLVAALAATIAARRNLPRAWPLGMLVAWSGVAAIGISLAGSVGAMVLLGPAVVASVFLVPGSSTMQRAGSLAAAAGIAVAAAVLSIGVLGTTFDEGDLSRASIWRTTWEAIAVHWPVGSGLGTFPDIYALYEDPNEIGRTYANHAHNDFLELVLELGLVGAVLIGLVLAIYGACVLRAWRGPMDDPRIWQRAATIVLGVLLAHSIGDYPLRTPALMMVALYFGVIACTRPRAPGGDGLSKSPSENRNTPVNAGAELRT